MADSKESPAKQPGSGAKRGKGRLDLASVGGLALAAAGIVGGLILEKGDIRDITQVTAAIIVLGGTFGAVMVTTPLSVLGRAARKIPLVFFEPAHRPDLVIEEILSYATKARKSGIVSLEKEAEGIADPFLRKALNLAIDGTDLQELRNIMEIEIGLEEHRGEEEAKVFEAAGGYAPTIGIIGAVLGLIQVMKHLANIEEVGHGIAVAFVATVYGVAVANILFLPMANKLRARVHHEISTRELTLEGVIGIVEGLNPKLVRVKLEAYTQGAAQPGKAKKAAAKAGADGE